jgi:hypothetical protein
MRVPLDPGDRKLLIVSGALLALLTAAATVLSPPAERSPLGLPSSYSTAPQGAKAAYLLLGEMGYRVERWAAPPQDLPSQPQNLTFVLAGPLTPPSSEEQAGLRAFIHAGGRVLATGDTAARLLPQSEAHALKQRAPEPKRYTARLPGPLSRHAPVILMDGHTRWTATRPNHLAYYGDEDGATVVHYRLGKGEVIWWADSLPLENNGLKQASNLELFLNSFGPPAGSRIFWDEYFHGQRPGLWSYLSRTPVPWSGVQLAALGLALLFTFGRRHGPLRPAKTSGIRLSPLEFVETVGELYERKRAAAGALEIAYHRFRFLLLRRLGLPDAANPSEIGRGVRERLGWTAPGLEDALQKSEQAVKSEKLREAEALRLVQELHDYARRFRLTAQVRAD